MGSLSKKTDEKRRLRKARAGRRNKKQRQLNSSRPFPIHPEKAGVSEDAPSSTGSR